MAKTVVGLFEQPGDAQAAFQEITSVGISSSNVHLIDKATGRITTALTEAGVPEHDAALYDAGVRSGGGLIIAQALPDREAMQVVEILDRHNVVDLDQRGRSTQHTGSAGMATSSAATTGGSTTQSTQRRSQHYDGNEMVVPIIEEQVQVGKQQVEGGGVRVQTHVTEKPVNEQVTLHEEAVHVERRPVNQPVDAAKLDQLKEGSFEVREMNERAVVNKEARVVEEVVINKEAHERTENIQDTVRRTDVNVEQLQSELRPSGSTETTARTQGTGYGTTTERGTSKAGNVVERAAGAVERGAEDVTGSDLNKSGGVGDRNV